jgi:hypothetical protein
MAGQHEDPVPVKVDELLGFHPKVIEYAHDVEDCDPQPIVATPPPRQADAVKADPSVLDARIYQVRGLQVAALHALKERAHQLDVLLRHRHGVSLARRPRANALTDCCNGLYATAPPHQL